SFVITDGDNNPPGGATGTLNIEFNDDMPSNNGTTLTAPTVHEDALNNGNAVGNSEGGQTVSASISVASLLTLVDIGADSPGSIGLNPLIDGVATGLTQLGVSIVWDYVDATHVRGVLESDPSHVVFTITRNGSNYDFTLLDNIDNNPSGPGDADTDSLSLANVFTASDADNDTIVIDAGASVNIQNDVPINNGQSYNAGTVHEDALNNANAVGNSEGGQVTSIQILGASLAGLVTPGADSPVTISLNSIAFGSPGTIEGTATGLTQLGVSITWHVVGPNQVNGVLNGDVTKVIFTITDNPGDANFTFTLLDNIDNNPSAAGDGDTDSLSLANVFTATDTDGDKVIIDAGATVNIQNDVPINNSGTVSITVHEDALNNANAVGNNEGGKTVSGSITVAQLQALVTPGADSPVTIGLNPLIDGVATGLTQLGVSIVWDYVDATHVRGLVGNDPTKVAFTLTFDGPNGEYDFTLLDNIDNNPSGPGDADTDSLSLANVFTATDTDGDSIVIDAGASVNIENDVPINNSTTYAVGTVHEDALANANADGNPEGLGQTTTIQVLGASLLTLVTPGADSPVALALNNAAFGQPGSIEGSATGLFQGGVSITWHVVSATQINGVLNGDPTKIIFTLTDNPGDTNFTFTLVDNIDHDNDNNLLTGEGDSFTESLSLAGVFTATDTDGDKVVIDAGASLNIENDIPIAVSAGAITSGLENGGGDSASANLDAGGNNIVADNMGADGGKVIFTNASITALEGQDLKHGGTELIYRFTPDGQTLRGFVDNGDGLFGAGDTLVFTIQLQTGVGGNEYTVTMNDSIDSITTVDFNDGSYNFVGGNDPWAGFNQPLINDSPDLLVTPFSATGVGDAINGNANSYGTTGGGGGQNVGGGEGIRLDFVTDLTGNPAGSPANYDGNVAQQDHAFEGHYLVQDVSVRFGDGTGNSTVKIEAFDNTDAIPDDKVLGVGELVNITQIVINFDGEAQAF
ncbi:MAG TPA: hypothetical protein VF491_05560, partial [Vicinamibacterales bacterium]